MRPGEVSYKGWHVWFSQRHRKIIVNGVTLETRHLEYNSMADASRSLRNLGFADVADAIDNTPE